MPRERERKNASVAENARFEFNLAQSLVHDFHPWLKKQKAKPKQNRILSIFSWMTLKDWHFPQEYNSSVHYVALIFRVSSMLLGKLGNDS